MSERPSARGFAALVGALLLAIPGAAQTPDEHAQHHPESEGGGAGMDDMGAGGMGGMGAGGMGGMGAGGMGGMGAGGMGEMMERMGAPTPRDLYPALMELPDLPPERRQDLEQEAQRRMVVGSQQAGEALDALALAARRDDDAAMQRATIELREAVSVFDSGLAARRALREGRAPRSVALEWFKREMSLTGHATPGESSLLWGMSAFHTGVMAILIAFATAMIVMYFHKMRRASQLLEALTAAETGGVASPPPGGPAPSTPAPTGPPASQAEDAGGGDSVDTDGECCEPAEGATPPEAGGLLPQIRKRLCRLRVARIIDEAEGVKTFRLVDCHGGGIPFSYLPGQFLTFTLPVEGADKPVRRSYTISSAPTQGYYCEITVKREEKGVGSRFLHDQVAVGDTLEVIAPAGRFTFRGDEADSIVLIGGGVGITPMMSIARTLTDMAWTGPIDLIVACKSPAHFIFESELERLAAEYPNLRVHVAMSDLEADLGDYRAGRLDAAMIREWVPDISGRRVHICGPAPMMDAVKEMLKSLGVPQENVHTENFGAAAKPKAAGASPTPKAAAPAGDHEVAFVRSKETTRMGAEETVLEASERVGVDIPWSCRVGSCGICLARMTEGRVSMEVKDGLAPEDEAKGFVLACQAVAETDLEIDA
jgi:ferredoxin-NADP reductase